jgi:hypothetical protein
MAKTIVPYSVSYSLSLGSVSLEAIRYSRDKKLSLKIRSIQPSTTSALSEFRAREDIVRIRDYFDNILLDWTCLDEGAENEHDQR